uniref:Cytochrome b-c1 complex subunit Rieske, mitochondrial n=1 Tax=Ascaris suum TaxID=6253 RepID=F1L9A3_ASCSU
MALTRFRSARLVNAVCLETTRFNFSFARCPFVPAITSVNSMARRSTHTDVKFPHFEDFRRRSTLDINKAARESEDHRRALPHAIYYGVGGVMTLLTAKESIQALVAFKGMAADQKALASIEVKMEEIPEGQTKTFEWQGKPVFVKHRTAREIQREREVVVSELRHPQTDEERVQKPEWSVLIGVCTHLGCVPIPGAGDFPGGYFCPCHGTHFDGSGRIRKGPAPLNLNIPPYTFKDDTIVIGTTS